MPIGLGITRLTTTASQESQPAWSPDGGTLAFVVDNTRIDGRDASGAVRTMFEAPAGTSVAAPSWAPDGVRIAYQALRAATVEGARLIGHASDLGTVERGKLADLAFVRGNPLRRIKTVANVRLVMKNGTLYSRRDLLAPFVRGAAARG